MRTSRLERSGNPGIGELNIQSTIFNHLKIIKIFQSNFFDTKCIKITFKILTAFLPDHSILFLPQIKRRYTAKVKIAITGKYCRKKTGFTPAQTLD